MIETINRKTTNLLKQLHDGDRDIIVELVELQRVELFDYLFRMCGQRDTVMRVMDEAVVELKADRHFQPDSPSDFRVRLFATCRSFCSHIWNADTSELNNEGYETLTEGDERFTAQQMRDVEKVLAGIPGWEREPALLHLRCGFSLAEVARVMSISEASVEDSLNNAYLKVAQVSRLDPGSIEIAIGSIPIHPETKFSTNSTAALSQIMGDIGEAKTGWFTVRRLVFVLCVLSVAFLIYQLF